MMTTWRSTIAGCILATLAGVAYAQSAGDDALSAQVDEVVRAQMREQKWTISTHIPIIPSEEPIRTREILLA